MSANERDIVIDVTVKSSGHGGREAAGELRETEKAADGAGKSMRDLTRDSKSLNEEIVQSKVRIRELGAEFQRTGEKSTLIDLRRERSRLNELKRIAKEAEDGFQAMLRGGDEHELKLKLPKLDFSNLVSESRGTLIAGLVGVAVLASPAIGAAIAGAVAGTVAGGGIIGGVIAAAHDDRVKAAWKDFTAQMTPNAFGAAELVTPTIGAIEQLKSTFHDINLDETFAKAGPAIGELADGVSGFVENIMPGFNAVMDDSEAIMAVFGDGLADTGDALSDMLTDIVSSKGTLEGLHFLFMFLNGTLRATGNTLEFLGNAFHKMVHAAAIGTGNYEDIFGWIPGVGNLLSWMNDNMEAIEDTAPNMASGMTGIADAAPGAAAGIGSVGDTSEEAARQVEDLRDQLFQLQGAQIDASAASDRLNKDLIELSQSVQENGTSLDDHTEDGLRNRDMLRGLVEDLRAQYEANIRSGMSADDARALYVEQGNELQRLAEKLGFSKEAVAELIGEWKLMPTVVTTEYRTIYTQSVGGYGGGEHSGLGDVRDKRAVGGPVLANQDYIVGENGPELLRMGPQPGYVIPTADAKTATGAWGGTNGGWVGGTPGMDVRPLVVSGDSFVTSFFAWFREQVEAMGGTLAVVGVRG